LTLGKTALAEGLQSRTHATFAAAILDIWLGGDIISNTTTQVAVLIDGPGVQIALGEETSRQGSRRVGSRRLGVRERHPPADDPELDALMAKASVIGIWKLPRAVARSQATAQGTGMVRWETIEPRGPAACRIRWRAIGSSVRERAREGLRQTRIEPADDDHRDQDHDADGGNAIASGSLTMR
jgi:hypothetical protein